ncbi:hypothetical protein DIQ79_18155 [Mycolicibacterium smegmatis]|uniref:Uncharacterized protein n=2 Tax=Mycolicibacterium smegmatis TaxID=1772 RepID=A0R4W1_MYCS2|nr:hypothetical protein MSMEG_5973 [Mycolicibacterium smegmatis MC2 155]TBM49868.1 hypothetical protein DIQ85_18160 [Mycolicibacterium smegmatis]TBH39842.1 hypothetical protein EYS45_16795 [Mycolicibacterium smegmatis MC2 155]TBM50568.1 hypothetical protein DIQ86_07685 [Mycolicibacterium smegmatis]TBM60296.1 hypothetical protein DIQ83_18220 [Mycolicibacterium smegmatis]
MKAFQVYGIIEPSNVPMPVTGLVRTLGHGCTPAAEGCHLWHERHAVEATIGIKRCDDFRQRSDLDEFTDAEWAINI